MNKFITPGKVKEVNGSILTPELAGLRLILNVCGESGNFDSKTGNVLAKKWARVREDYRFWYSNHNNFKVGSLNTTAVGSDTWVIHMLVEDKNGKVDQGGLKAAVKKLADMAKYEKASVHVSTFITDSLPELKPLLQSMLVDEGINVFFYKEPVK